MALTDPKDTLAYHMSRPLTTARDMGDIPLSKLTAKVKLLQQSDPHSNTVPEREALWFYGLNHGLAEIQKTVAPYEPLGQFKDFVDNYHGILGPKAVRAFYYMLMICTREARHNQSLHIHGKDIASLFGDPIAKFFTSIKGGEAGIHSALLAHPPAVTVRQYCDSLAWAFYKCHWSPSYGGPKWGAVADCLCRFVRGEFTAEMMLDTVWTLCHNNGPIFNKGIFYSHHSGHLIRILDVQRAGYIPTAALTDAQIKGFAEPSLKDRMEWIKKQFPAAVPDYVDWYVVEALGAQHKYKQDKEAQKLKYGISGKAAEMEAKSKAIAEAKKQAFLLAQAAKQESEFEVHPGLVLKKFKLNRAA